MSWNIYAYLIVSAVLLAAELLYFRIADKLNIIDKPNERSSHTKVVLRGGGIIFVLGVWIWAAAQYFIGHSIMYPVFLASVTLAAGISFVDDIHSLPDSVRLGVQFIAMMLMAYEVGMIGSGQWLLLIVSLIVCIGATNIFNFMDGINGITGAYSLSVLIPLYLLNSGKHFMEESFIVVAALSVLVFCIFNFRPRNKARCFAGDVGSVGIAFILLFCLAMLVMQSGDVLWFTFLVVYGIDGLLTIIHRIQLHESLGEAHRKHAYQIMANELKMSHITVSLLYMGLQLLISLPMVYLVPDTPLAHLVYLVCVMALLGLAYLLFMKKYYHLHEEYLASIKK